jgi:hypothetical protein
MDHRLLEQKPMPLTMKDSIRLAAAAVLLGASGTILAFPCYQSEVSGEQSKDGYPDSCANGPANNRIDSTSNLDALFGETLELVERLNTAGSSTGGEIAGAEAGSTSKLTMGPDDKGNYDFFLATWTFQDIDFRDGYSDMTTPINDEDKCAREGGCGPAEPDNGYKAHWSAFQVTLEDPSGTWSMPEHGLSHISFEVR